MGRERGKEGGKEGEEGGGGKEERSLEAEWHTLLTLGAHAQQGLQYLCVCVCVCVCVVCLFVCRLFWQYAHPQIKPKTPSC